MERNESFDSMTIDGNAARKIATERCRSYNKNRRDNVCKLTDKEIRRTRRQSISFLLVTRNLLIYFLILGLCAYIVANNVVLNELTGAINATQKHLQEAKSSQIQLEMQMAIAKQEFDYAAYAKEHLGMEPIQPGQITYIRVFDKDGGTIYKPITLWDRIVMLFD